MGRWIVAAQSRRREREYKLPSRCPQCNTRQVWAQIEGEWVVELCGYCDYNRRVRLIREEADTDGDVAGLASLAETDCAFAGVAADARARDEALRRRPSYDDLFPAEVS